MKYQLELEVEIDDGKISFTEEFFKSIPFVRKVTMITPETKQYGFISETSDDDTTVKTKLSDKYRGVFSMEDAKSFDEHTQMMRAEWDSI